MVSIGILWRRLKHVETYRIPQIFVSGSRGTDQNPRERVNLASLCCTLSTILSESYQHGLKMATGWIKYGKFTEIAVGPYRFHGPYPWTKFRSSDFLIAIHVFVIAMTRRQAQGPGPSYPDYCTHLKLRVGLKAWVLHTHVYFMSKTTIHMYVCMYVCMYVMWCDVMKYIM